MSLVVWRTVTEKGKTLVGHQQLPKGWCGK